MVVGLVALVVLLVWLVVSSIGMVIVVDTGVVFGDKFHLAVGVIIISACAGCDPYGCL